MSREIFPEEMLVRRQLGPSGSLSARPQHKGRHILYLQYSAFSFRRCIALHPTSCPLQLYDLASICKQHCTRRKFTVPVCQSIQGQMTTRSPLSAGGSTSLSEEKSKDTPFRKRLRPSYKDEKKVRSSREKSGDEPGRTPCFECSRSPAIDWT